MTAAIHSDILYGTGDGWRMRKDSIKNTDECYHSDTDKYLSYQINFSFSSYAVYKIITVDFYTVLVFIETLILIF